jgi:hypothetical protein
VEPEQELQMPQRLDIAKLRVKSLMNFKPADYAILNKETGYKTFILLESPSGPWQD